jgi:hypothetical protein
VQFTDTSDVPGANGWLWRFGDGTTSTEQNPVHSYLTEGNFDVALEVVGDNGLAVHAEGAYVMVGVPDQGLRAEYFDDQFLTEFTLSRVDPVVDFSWGEGSPDPDIGINTFSVRWSGEVQATHTGTHTFTTYTDDGVRLWVGGQLLVDRWIDQSPEEHYGTVDLVAGGRYEVIMEYFENGGGAVAELHWEAPGLAREIVPTSQLWPLTGVSDVPRGAPAVYALGGNHPNPFNPRTTISFTLARDSVVDLAIFDLRGRRVAAPLAGESLPAGSHRQPWLGLDDGGRPVSSGVYLYRLEARNSDGSRAFAATDRMLLLR